MRTQLSSAAAAVSLAFAGGVIRPSEVSAHVKWFVDQGVGHGAAVTFSIDEPAVQIWAGVIVAAIAVALLLDGCLAAPPAALTSFLRRHRQHCRELFQLLVGLGLLLTAIKGALLAPHLADAHAIGVVLRFVEGTAGILLIANKGVRVAGGLLVVVFLASTVLFGFVSSLEYFNFLGIAVFLLLSPSAGDVLPGRFSAYAVPLLRIHTGIALGVLAFTEKLLNPTMAIRFVEENHFNFMSALGADLFTDRLFILSAGCSELLFGIIFALGLVTRINTVSLAVFLISSNTYFFAIGKLDEAFLELTGHLSLLAIALLLILHGSGSKLRVSPPFVWEPGGRRVDKTWAHLSGSRA